MQTKTADSLPPAILERLSSIGEGLVPGTRCTRNESPLYKRNTPMQSQDAKLISKAIKGLIRIISPFGCIFDILANPGNREY
jgi:hypothetical protein